MLSHYRKAKEEGWKPEQYKAEVILKDKEQLTIHLEGTWYQLIEYGWKYSGYHMTSTWKITKDGKEIDAFSYYSFWESVEEMRKLYDFRLQ